ncbi:MAG: hypothetical protein QXT73_05165 [Candidatus Methanomethylicaceae archaeon]
MITYLINHIHPVVDELTRHFIFSEFKMYELHDHSKLVFVPDEHLDYFKYSVNMIKRKIEAKYLFKPDKSIVEPFEGDPRPYLESIYREEEKGKIWCYKTVLPAHNGQRYRSLIANIWPKLALRYDYHEETIAPETKAILASENPFDALYVAWTIVGQLILTLMAGFGTPIGHKVKLAYFNTPEEYVERLNLRDLDQPESTYVYESLDNTLPLSGFTPWVGCTWFTSAPEDW